MSQAGDGEEICNAADFYSEGQGLSASDTTSCFASFKLTNVFNCDWIWAKIRLDKVRC